MAAPKPVYRRETIDLDGPKRSWQEVSWASLERGDIVLDHGAVESVTDGLANTEVAVAFISGEVVHARWPETVRAFTRRR